MHPTRTAPHNPASTTYLLEVVLLGDDGPLTAAVEGGLVHGGGRGVAGGVKARGEVVDLLIPEVPQPKGGEQHIGSKYVSIEGSSR